MDRDDADPTRALDGWRADRGPQLSDAELRGLLDGWKPAAAPKGRRACAEPPVKLAFRAPPSPASAEPVALDAVARRVARGAARWAASEITDIDLDWQPSPTAVPATVHPRLCQRWEPGCWVVAERELAPSRTEVRDGPQGPVVETFPALRIVAWWPPAADGAPLGRWPQRAALVVAEPEAVADALLAPLPAEARVHRTDPAQADWTLIGQLVRLHDAGLPAHQFEALEAFVDAERQAQFVRLNDGYHRPVPGAPIERRG